MARGESSTLKLGGAGVGVDVHRTCSDVMVLRLCLGVVAKFLPSTDGVAEFAFTEVEVQQRHWR